MAAVAFAFAAMTLAAPAFAQDIAALERELGQAMSLTPDLERGRTLYHACIGCHGETGWGSADGTYPQIAGQHRRVIIKQIADIRFGMRDNPVMLPYVAGDALDGPQALADIAGYVSALPMNPDPGVGPGTDLAGGQDLFERKCAKCHLNDGAGEDETAFPKITGQNYAYMLRELNWMKEGKRRNALRSMVKRIENMTAADLEALADYISRLKPTRPQTAGTRAP